MSDCLLNDQIRGFLHSGVAVMMGTRDADLIPEAIRGWGPVETADGTINVCIGLAAGQKTLENLADNRQVTLALSSPLNYAQYQIKGRCAQVVEANAEDVSRVESHREAFIIACESIGTARSVIERLYLQDVGDPPVLVNVRFEPEQIFNQTPGPTAGNSL